MIRPPRLRRAVLLAIVVGALLIGGWWWFRDLPRRVTQDVLSARLAARVRLGGLTIVGLRHFVLEDVSITEVRGFPWVERIDVGRLEVTGDLPAIRAGRVEALYAVDTRIRVSPPKAVASSQEGVEPPTASIGRLEAPEGEIVVAAGGSEARLGFDASIDGIGGELSGEIRSSARTLPLAPLLAMVELPGAARASGSLEGLSAVVSIHGAGPVLDLEAQATELAVASGGRALRFPGPALDLRLTVEPSRLAVELHPKLPFLESGEIRARIDRAGRGLLGLDGALRGVDLSVVTQVFGALPPGWTVDGRADLDLHGTTPNTLDVRIRALLPRVAAESEGVDFVARNARLEVDGTLPLALPARGGPVTSSLEVSAAEGTVLGRSISAFFPLHGSFRGNLALGETIGADGLVTVEASSLGSLSATGAARLEDGRPAVHAKWTWTGARLEEITRRTDLVDLPPDLVVAGTIEASGTCDGALSRPSIAASVRSGSLLVSLEPEARGEKPAIALRDATATARLAWEGDLASPVDVRGFELRGKAVGRGLVAPLTLAGSGRVGLQDRSARFESGSLESPGLVHARLAGSWNPRESPPGSLRADVDGLDVESWQPFLRPVVRDLAPGYSAKGKATGSIEGTFDDAGHAEATVRAEIRGSGFSSKDGTRVVEGLDTTWDVRAERDLGGRLHVTGTAAVGGFQALWGSFFADYSGLSSSLAIDAESGGKEGDPRWKGRAVLRYPEGPAIDATLASAGGDELRYQVEASIEDLGPALEKYFRAPLADAVPLLEKLHGAGAVHLSAHGAISHDTRTVAGSLRLAGLGLKGAEGLAEIEGLDLDLPIDARFGPPAPDGTRPVAGPRLPGSLRFAKILVRGLEIPGTESRLLIEGDTVRLEEGLSVAVLGGSLDLEDVTLADLSRPSRRADTSLDLSHVSLRRACEAFGLPLLDGELNGRFPKVHLTAGAFTVDGGGEATLFGGRVRVGGISGEDVLSHYPKLTFSADFEDIDLEQVTGTFDVGRMTGIVRGHAHDLVLFRGVPVRFDAEIRTVQRKGVPRTIDVKAIQNIAVLGTGGPAGVFGKGIYRFFDHYTYESLGVHLTLVDDVFLLRGLERRGDRELFLAGRLPFRIDVVNVEPGKTVSFATMLDRLRSLDFGKATTAPPGPASRSEPE